jgi:hypothetical protein
VLITDMMSVLVIEQDLQLLMMVVAKGGGKGQA